MNSDGAPPPDATRPLWGPARQRPDAGGPPVPPPPPPALPPPTPPPAQPSPPSHPARTPLLIAGAVVAVLVVASVAVATLRPTSDDTPAAVPPSVAAAAPTAAPSITAPSITAPSTAPGLVELQDEAAAHPAADAVQALLDRHFRAINDRDYATWADTVVPRRADQQPADAWQRNYRSTRDSGVRITSIVDTGPDAVEVHLSFVSEQALADAPRDLRAERICWESRWPVRDLAAGGVLDTPPSGSTSKNAC